jgi:hypothetical protein
MRCLPFLTVTHYVHQARQYYIAPTRGVIPILELLAVASVNKSVRFSFLLLHATTKELTRGSQSQEIS